MGSVSTGSSTARRVLVVEDEQPAIRLYQEAFSELDSATELTVARDGETALEVLFDGESTQEGPDVVILDIELPGIDGTEVLRRIRDDDTLAELPVVIVSNTADQAIIDECYQLGVNAYLRKPDDYDGLLNIVREVGSFWVREEVQLPTQGFPAS
jgi:two-component system response regulator